MMNKQHSIYGTSSMRQNVPDWVPANYIEKGKKKKFQSDFD